MSDDPAAYVRDDGAVAIRASALGRCSRYLWAMLDDIEPAGEEFNFLARAAEEGQLHEPAIRETLNTRYDHDVSGDQEPVELWIIPDKLVVVGHIDGVCRNHNKLTEIKTMSRRVFDDWVDKEWDSKPTYAWQLSAYMFAMGWPDEIVGAEYAVKRRDDGLLWVQDYDKPPISLKQVRKKAIGVLKAWKSGAMPACDVENRFPCPVFFLHDEDEPTPKEYRDEPDLDALAAMYVEIGLIMSDLKRERDLIKEQMAEFRDGRDQWATERHTFKVSKVSRRTIDKAAIVVDHGEDFLKRYESDDPYERWTVKGR